LYAEREEFRQRQKETTFHPYETRSQYVTTKKLTTPSIATETIIRQFGVKDPDHEGHNHDGLFRSTAEFYRCLDMIVDTQAEWQELDVVGRKGEYNCKAYTRDPKAVLQEILDNPKIKNKVVWAPRRMYDQAGDRVYTDLYSTHWWWKTQVATTYNFVLTQGIGQQNLRKPLEQDDNPDNLIVRQNNARGLFGYCYGVAFVHDDWECCRVRTI
jgi:hypothetical protein